MPTLLRPKVSVIIPVHNEGAVVEKCLESLLIQDYPGLELVVVNDASSDDTASRVSKYPVRLISNHSNHGAAYSRNRGAEDGDSEILVFVDGDIVVPPAGILKLVGSFIQRPSVLAVGGTYSENTKGLNFITDYKNMDLVYRTMLCRDYVKYLGGFFFAIRRSVFREAGGFPDGFSGSSAEDIEFGYRVTKGKCGMFIDKDIAVDHLKRYTLFSMLKTDCVRVANMMKIIRDSKGRKMAGEHAPLPSLVNLFLPGPILLSFAVLPFFKAAWAVSVVLILAFIVNNSGFLRFLIAKRSVLFAVKSLVVLLIEYAVVDAAMLTALIRGR